MKFTDIKQFTAQPHYSVHCDWDYFYGEDGWLERELQPFEGMSILQTNPDFQRGHVWTEEQQILYVEYKLRGGPGAEELLFNHPGWTNDYKGAFVLVDGLQRLTAAERFMNNEIPAFNKFYKDYSQPIRRCRGSYFIVKVNTLRNRHEVLQWYLELNHQGTPHTEEELKRVKKLYDSELKIKRRDK